MKVPFLMMIIVVVMALQVPVAFADHHAIKIVQQESLGKYLTDGKGMTLYWFANDQPGMSACLGMCLEKWPAYYQENPIVPESIAAGDFSSIKRSDGSMQTTFRGYPLYYFFKDKTAGEIKGHEVKNVWYIVNPDNFPNR